MQPRYPLMEKVAKKGREPKRVVRLDVRVQTREVVRALAAGAVS